MPHLSNTKKIIIFAMVLIGAVILLMTQYAGKNKNTTIESAANITVSEPVAKALVGNPFIVRGQARVFESQFNWRLRDADGAILGSGPAYAHAPDAGQFGPFEITVTYMPPKGPTGTLEVFDYSAKDGAEIDLVRVPVRFKVAP